MDLFDTPLWGAFVGRGGRHCPFFGGSLITLFGWRSIFYHNVPIGAVGILLSALLLQPSSTYPKPFGVTRHALFMLSRRPGGTS